MLEQEFTELFQINDVLKVETRIRNIRFICELTKFGVPSS
jgi:hypothetical protein